MSVQPPLWFSRGCTDIRKFEVSPPQPASPSLWDARGSCGPSPATRGCVLICLFDGPNACDPNRRLVFSIRFCVPGPPHLQQTGRRYTRALVGHGSHAGQRYFVTDRKRWTERFTWSCGAREVVATGSSIRPADFRHGRWRRLGLSRRRNPLMALFPHGLAWFISSREAHDVPILGINLISPNPPPPHASPPAPPDS